MQWLISMSFLYLPHCFLSLPSQRKKEGRRPPTAPFLLYSLQLLHVPNCRFHVSRKEGVIPLISHGKDALYKKLSLRQLLHGFARRPIGRGEIHAPPKRKHTSKVCRVLHEEYNCPPRRKHARHVLSAFFGSPKRTETRYDIRGSQPRRPPRRKRRPHPPSLLRRDVRSPLGQAPHSFLRRYNGKMRRFF